MMNIIALVYVTTSIMLFVAFVAVVITYIEVKKILNVEEEANNLGTPKTKVKYHKIALTNNNISSIAEIMAIFWNDIFTSLQSKKTNLQH